LLCIAALLFSACINKHSNNKKVFYYNETTGIASLDPAFAKNQSVMWAIHQLYNTLVEVDSNLNIVPSLAKQWEISADRCTYTFHLRTDVYFQSVDLFAKQPRKLTAHDVVYSFSRIVDKKTASSGAWIFNNRIASLQPFTAIDDSTFQLKLLKPFYPILGILSMQYCSIVAHEAVEQYGKDFFVGILVVPGLFQLKLWDEGQAMILEK